MKIVADVEDFEWIPANELDQYQTWVAETTSTIVPEEQRGWWAASILSCEAAEVLELHEKAIRKEGKYAASIERVADELGDTLWSLAAVANAYGLSLHEILEANVTKINARVYADEAKG